MKIKIEGRSGEGKTLLCNLIVQILLESGIKFNVQREIVEVRGRSNFDVIITEESRESARKILTYKRERRKRGEK